MDFIYLYACDGIYKAYSIEDQSFELTVKSWCIYPWIYYSIKYIEFTGYSWCTCMDIW